MSDQLKPEDKKDPKPYSRDWHNARMRSASGHVDDRRNLVSFLYELIRDHLPAGTVEEIVRNSMKPDELWAYTNGWIADYARYCATLLGVRSLSSQTGAVMDERARFFKELVEESGYQFDQVDYVKISRSGQISYDVARPPALEGSPVPYAPIFDNTVACSECGMRLYPGDMCCDGTHGVRHVDCPQDKQARE